jgi:hypothetical protein
VYEIDIGMQNFVHRAASPQHSQNGKHINPERQSIAANAKVSMKKKPTPQQSHEPPVQTGIPSRGFGRAQDSSAAVQHGPLRRHSDRPQKQDAYDTDVESIDTTVNQSVIQVEDDQVRNPQHEQHGGVVDLGSAGLDDDDEEEDEGDEESVEEEFDPLNPKFTQGEMDFLEEQGQLGLEAVDAYNFLMHRPEGFRTVDGDSYPSTTDGNPTEWDGAQMPHSEHRDGHLDASNRHPLAPPPMERGSASVGTGHIAQGANKLFQQGAHLRGQQRVNDHPRQKSGHTYQPHTAPVQSSQPPSYSQAHRDAAPAQPSNPNTRPVNRAPSVQPYKYIQRQQPGHLQAVSQPTRPTGVSVNTQHPTSARIQIVPDIQYQHEDPAPSPSQEAAVRPDCDYDPGALEAMEYRQLKNESFDTDPRTSDHPLSTDMRQKPLKERLIYAKENFDAGKQSDFFHALPTAEWEDAGDWFLDQFSEIIQRTKQARQKKRKLAQEFEDEIETRHKHVSKKYRQVQDAMSKMQAQGEGLVPRSPRPSKSPKPKRR